MKALQSVYPEHSKIWKEYKGKGYWKDLQNQRAFFDSLAVKLNIQKPEDWYNIQGSSLWKEKGGHFIKNHYNSSLIAGKTIYT
jgi:hypothetical protein